MMKSTPGWMPAIRWVLFAVLLINAVTLTVYFRMQEMRLKYQVSRLQEEVDRQKELTREYSIEVLQTAQQGRLDGQVRDWQPELGGSNPR
jgi:hypothetical protein